MPGTLRHPFEQRILDIRKRVGPEPFDWYTFDSFATLTHLDALLPGGVLKAADLAGNEPLADIGTGDGDMGFLFESLGSEVVAMDWPGVNANRMLGVNLMKRELGSSVEIREVDLDDGFRLDGERFGLALAFGLLYHLKNPFWFLEHLARHSRLCLLSTAILPKRGHGPIAYLSGEREFQSDSTNYWFFSEAGLLRLLDRCGWDVTHTYVTGGRRDPRFFCLAESRSAKTVRTIRLLSGWHEIENNAWRWTKREFEAVIDNAGDATTLELRFRSPGDVTVQAELNGTQLPSLTFPGAGDHTYRQPATGAARRNHIRVTLSRAMDIGGRELGVIVVLPNSTLVDEDTGLRLL
jgi:hypothetical protein